MGIMTKTLDRYNLLRENLNHAAADELDEQGRNIDAGHRLYRACMAIVKPQIAAMAIPAPHLEELAETENRDARTMVDRLLSDIRPGLLENRARRNVFTDDGLRAVLPPTSPVADLMGIDVAIRPEPPAAPFGLPAEATGQPERGVARVAVRARGCTESSEHRPVWQLATVTMLWLAYQRLDGMITFHFPVELHGFHEQNPISLVPSLFQSKRFSQFTFSLETAISQDHKTWYGLQKETVLHLHDYEMPLYGRIDEVRSFTRSLPARGSLPVLLLVRLRLEALAQGEGAFAELDFGAGPDNFIRVPYVTY